jgi:hypothetical protein
MPLKEAEPTSIQTGDKMRKVRSGTQIKAQTDLGEDFAIILEHQPSPYSKDVYLVQWEDGSQTLFELKKENLLKNKKKVKSAKKQTN